MIGNPYKGRGFKGLIRYLHEGRANDPNPHRVIWSEAGNLPTNDPKIVAGIMRATAELSRGVKKPVYHLPISWPPEEQLPREMQVQVAKQLLSDLGLSEHQHLIVAHDDGDCPHIHLVVNTVHPETGRVWSAWRDVYRIMESLERQEKDLGLQIVHRPDLEDHREGRKDPDRKKTSRDERKRAEREGDTPLVKWSEQEMRAIRGDITDHFKQAVSWADLETRLRQHDLQLRRAGQGFRITDGNHFMTMSKVGKHAREDRLEERFGESWEDYELTRDMPDDLADRLEPPDVKKPESGLEEMDMLYADKQAEKQAETDELVKQAFRAASNYEYRQSQMQQARALGERLVQQKRAARRGKFIMDRISNDIQEAEGQFDALCGQLYRNPRKARQNIEKALADGQSLDEIDLTRMGKARGWRLLNWRSKARKDAQKALRQLPRAHDRLYRLNSQMDAYAHDDLTTHAKMGDTVARYTELQKLLGKNREERRMRSYETATEMAIAMRQISETEIWQSSLDEDAKALLARRWENVLGRDQRRDRAIERGLPGFVQGERERSPQGPER